MEHIASISYGKDSLAMLEVIHRYDLPLDRIIHVEIMATPDIHADLPPMVEFKRKADEVIKKKYGLTVEHITAPKSYEEYFYSEYEWKSKNAGHIYGFPLQQGNWCNSRLKVGPLRKAQGKAVVYIGIAVDEPKRFHNLSETKRSPLVEFGWTEKMCRDWCIENGLLSPIYKSALRGGCWFCHNQGVNQLRLLRKEYPDLWQILLKWDLDSPVTFKPDGHTVRDYDRRFQLESQGRVPMDRTFKWKMITEESKTMTKRIYTAESVTSGHPDKLADLIADNILDECLEQDENSRVACEVMLANSKCFISGEITTSADVDYEYIARSVIAQIGYDTTDIEVEVRIHEQSKDICQAVNNAEQGAGDQGIVYGYASNETLNFMPLPIELAHRLTDRLEECRKEGMIKGLLPDGKSQVSVEYDGDRFRKIVSVIVSAQHKEWKALAELTAEIKEKVIGRVFEEYDLTDAEILVNPSGRFVIGGFVADTGLTGRKLMVDTYGGIAHHGGGAMSGKDASKVDRSGAYLARYIAKNIVAAELAEQCEVALSYAIGVPMPVSVDVNTFYTGSISENAMVEAVKKVFDLSVAGTIDKLDLKRPVFAQTAAGGHFGKDFLAWEQIDKVEELKNAVLSEKTRNR